MKKLLVFTASWCNQCKVHHRNLDEFHRSNSEVEIEYIDADKSPELAENYGIRNLPTTIILENDKVVGKEYGILTLNKLKEIIL